MDKIFGAVGSLLLGDDDGGAARPSSPQPSDVSEVTYVTYPLGGRNFFSKGTQAQHAAVCVRHDKGEFELEVNTDGVKRRDECGTYRSEKLGEYKVADKPTKSSAEIERFFRSEFEGKDYKLGKNDCFAGVEKTAEYLGRDKASLDGPVGDRKGLANGTRYYSKKT